MELVIERERWLRGEGSGPSRLLRDDGKMCCLGFLGLALGMLSDALRGKTAFYRAGALSVEPPESAAWLCTDTKRCSTVAINLMEVNDTVYGDPSEQEEKITELFATQGITVRFV